MNADRKRAMKAGLRKRMRATAKARQCPGCGRKYALKRIRFDASSGAVVCRWCPYERATGGGS